jgi:hypothetical protein
MVRGRLTVQSDNGRYRGIVHAATTIIKEEGLRALYKGWLPSVIGVVPYVGLNFAVYETLKARACSARVKSRACALSTRQAVPLACAVTVHLLYIC